MNTSVVFNKVAASGSTGDRESFFSASNCERDAAGDAASFESACGIEQFKEMRNAAQTENPMVSFDQIDTC